MATYFYHSPAATAYFDMKLLLLMLTILFVPAPYYVTDADVSARACGYNLGSYEDYGHLVEGEPDGEMCKLNPPGNGFVLLYARFGGVGSHGITVIGEDECGWGHQLRMNFYRNSDLVQRSLIETESCDQPEYRKWDVSAPLDFDVVEFVVGPSGNSIAIDAIRAWGVRPFRLFAPILGR